MNPTALPVILGVALLLSAHGAGAEGTAAAAGPPKEQAARPRPPIDTALDANGDEIIAAAEIAGAAAALAKIDADGDGRLTAAEYLPARKAEKAAGAGEPGRPDRAPRDGRGAGPKPPIVTAIDVNADGILQAEEIAAARTALAKLDRNGDGRLAPDEYRPPRPSREGRSPDRTEATQPVGTARRVVAPATSDEGRATSGGPVISGVLLAFDPLRLVISGDGFRKGASVTIAGRPAPATAWKSEGLIVVAGASLETALPKGSPVTVVVVNPGGAQSPSWRFIR